MSNQSKYYFHFILLTFFASIYGQKPQPEGPKTDSAVVLPNLPHQHIFAKIGLKEGDWLYSYAGVLLKDLEQLANLDRFLQDLERDWEKTGKLNSFWKSNQQRIMKHTKGHFIKPKQFAENGKPLFRIVVKRELVRPTLWIDLEFYQPAGSFLSLFDLQEKLKEEAFKHYELGSKLFQKFSYTQALVHLKKSLWLFQQLPQKVSIITNLELIGSLYRHQGKYSLALKSYQLAIKFAQQLKNYNILAKLYNKLGRIYEIKSNYSIALKQYEQAQKAAEKCLNAYHHQATAINNIGLIYIHKGQYQKATQLFQKALEIVTKYNIPLIKGDIFNNIGLIYGKKALYDQALDYLQRSLALKNPSKVEQRSGIAVTLGNIGTIYSRKNKFQEALEYHKKALKIRKALKEPSAIADSLNQIGYIYSKQGYYESALEYFNTSLNLIENFDNPSMISTIINNIGVIYQTQQNYSQALKYLKRSLLLKQKVGEPSGIATTLNNLGMIYKQQGQFHESLNHYLQALKIREKLEDPIQIADSLDHIGSLYCLQNKFETALQQFHRAVQIKKEFSNPHEMAELYARMACVYLVLKQKEKAQHYFEKWILLMEQAVLQSGATREFLLKEHQDVYYYIIEFLLSDQQEEAFKLLQQCKAYGFLTHLTELSLDLERYVSPQLIAQKNRLVGSIAELYQELKFIDISQNRESHLLQQINRKRRKQETQLKRIREKIRTGNPAFGDIVYPIPVELETLQNILKPDQLFLEFFCTAKLHSNLIPKLGISGKSYCFVVGKESFDVFEIGDTTELDYEIAYFLRLLWESQEENSVPSQEFYPQGTKLFEKLIQPALNSTKSSSIKHLIIAPDENLNLLAFEALCLPQTQPPKKVASYQELPYLLDQFEVSYTMSATVYQQTVELYQQHSSTSLPNSFFGVGDPGFQQEKDNSNHIITLLTPLPGSRKEVENIAKLFPKTQQKVLLGTDAIEPNIFLENLKKYQILHFATHSLIDLENPMYSSLVLTPLASSQEKQFSKSLQEQGLNPINASDGFLQVQDIFQLHQKIDAQLIVLSACESARGKIHRGDGVLGLTRAFQFAGTPSVIVSLWPVSDESTNQLMQLFYQELIKSTSSSLSNNKLPALHMAKQMLRNSLKYNAPYYWAPFILRGLK